LAGAELALAGGISRQWSYAFQYHIFIGFIADLLSPQVQPQASKLSITGGLLT
jgi:hypothetical protein